MKKEIIRFEIDYLLDWEFSSEISKIRADLDAIEKLGATHVEFYSSYDYDNSSITIEAVSNRIETKQEYAERIVKLKQEEYEIRIRELELFKKLKEKYK